MYFSKKQQEVDEVIIEDTHVFACASDGCNGWMRMQFASDDSSCPLCGSNMNEEIRQLPKII
ncbi:MULTISPECIES: cold-inducible protein YdjO-related protein [Bacillus]|uniref:cold-inducible protein YdjO-related protein n=1 Tax=Bacillus TaxID=1386 RepID=UPI0002FE49DF|nr:MULTISPECIES: cold-inducible protein YdjO-related protein [Bacillus]